MNITFRGSSNRKLSPRAVMQRAPTIQEIYNKSHVSFNHYMDKNIGKEDVRPFLNINGVSEQYFIILIYKILSMVFTSLRNIVDNIL